MSEDPDLAVAGLDLHRPAKDLTADVVAPIGLDNLPADGGTDDRARRRKPVEPRVVLDAVLVRCPFRIQVRELGDSGYGRVEREHYPSVPPPGNGFPFRFLARSRKSAGNWISPNRRPSPGSPSVPLIWFSG